MTETPAGLFSTSTASSSKTTPSRMLAHSLTRGSLGHLPARGSLGHLPARGSLGHLPARHRPRQNRQYWDHREEEAAPVQETTRAGPGGAPVCGLDPFADGFLRDPFAFHAELREAGPVVWLER